MVFLYSISGAPRRLADADLAKFADANRHTSVCLFAAVPNPLVGFEPLGVQQLNEKHRTRRCYSLNWRAQKIHSVFVRAHKYLRGIRDGSPAFITWLAYSLSNPLVGFEPLDLHGTKNTHGFNRGYFLFWRAQKDSNPQPSDP